MGELNSRAQLLDVVRQVRRRWRLKLALRGAVGFLIAGVLAIVAMAYALEALKFTPAAIFCVPHRHRARAGRGRRVVLRAAAVAQGHRRAGRALSRRTRAHARLHHPQRDGGVREAGRLVARSDPAADRKRDRARARDSRRPAHRARPDAPLRLDCRRRRGGGASRSSPSAPPTCATRCRRIFVISSDAEAAAPYRIAVTPGQRHRSQGRGSDDQRHAVGIRCRRMRPS